MNSPSSAATKARYTPPPSAPTAHASSPCPATVPRGSGTASHGEIASKNSRPAACAADPLATLSLSAPSASSASHLSTSPQSGRDRAHPPSSPTGGGAEQREAEGAPSLPPPTPAPSTRGLHGKATRLP